jgi:hypothetical protein
MDRWRAPGLVSSRLVVQFSPFRLDRFPNVVCVPYYGLSCLFPPLSYSFSSHL